MPAVKIRMNIFRKKRPRNEAIIWSGENDAAETKDQAAPNAQSAPVSQVQDDFLGALASAAASEQASQETNSYISASEDSTCVAERIERISRRLDKLFERIDLVEHKVRRIEGKRETDY